MKEFNTTISETLCGMVGIIGLPNAGKSTLLNNLIGTKISIVSPKPQTTRFNIRGILTRKNYQIIFVDTPGLMEKKSLLNKLMLQEALSVLEEVDVILWVLDVISRAPKKEEAILNLIRETNQPTILVLNKVDLLKNKNELLPVIDYFAKIHDFRAIIPISALKGEGAERIEQELVKHLPKMAFLYPPEMATDLPLKLLVAEIIREKVLWETFHEVPYGVAVEVEEIEEDQPKGILHLRGIIYCERESQKGILIGKDGRMLKKVGSLARQELEVLLKRRVYLELWVKTLKDWRERESHLKRLIYPYLTRA